MESLWEKNVARVQFEAAKGNMSTSVLIVGGGIAGILCNYKLKKSGIDCALVEAADDNPATDDMHWK